MCVFPQYGRTRVAEIYFSHIFHQCGADAALSGKRIMKFIAVFDRRTPDNRHVGEGDADRATADTVSEGGGGGRETESKRKIVLK